jgi:peptidyl-prolyl cis-trans isomerase D
VLLRVLKVEPESVKSLEEVAPDLRKELAQERAKTEVTALYDKFEDERQLGTPIAQIAENLKIATRTFESDRQGRDAAGIPIASLPDMQRLLNAVFVAESGVENDPLRADNGYIWYEVTNITPSRDRTLEEVKAEVEAGWREDETAKRLRAKATETLDKVKAGTPLTEASAGLMVETKPGIKRGTPAAPLSPAAVEVIFRTGKGEAASAAADSPVEQLVFRVTDITVPSVNFESDEVKRLRQSLQNALSEDAYGQYIAQVESEIGVTINQRALLQIVSGQVPSDDN